MEILFAERLKMLRNEKKLTQRELAKELGTTQRRVSYWESQKIEPDLVSICKLCDFFSVSADFLLGRKDY